MASYNFIKHNYRDQMIVRLAKDIFNSNVDINFLKTIYSNTPYKDIVRPLLKYDYARGYNIERLTIRFGLTRRVVRYILDDSVLVSNSVNRNKQ